MSTLSDLSAFIRTGIANSLLEKSQTVAEDTREIGVIKVPNLPEHGGWVSAPTHFVNTGITTKIQAVTLQRGDVLITARGRGDSIKIAVAGDEAAGAIADANVVIIRPKSNVNSGAIAAFLSSAIGFECLKRAGRQSAALFSINPKQVSEIVVPSLSDEQQEAVGQLYFNAVAHFHACINLAEQSLAAANEAMVNIFLEKGVAL